MEGDGLCSPSLGGGEPNVPSVAEILEDYENKFSNRFTLEDEEYQKYVQHPIDPPPIIEDWPRRSGGSQRYRDGFRDRRQFRGRGSRYDPDGGYRPAQWQERPWGNSYQQHRQGEPSFSPYGRRQQGYSSYSQGPTYGRY